MVKGTVILTLPVDSVTGASTTFGMLRTFQVLS